MKRESRHIPKSEVGGAVQDFVDEGATEVTVERDDKPDTFRLPAVLPG